MHHLFGRIYNDKSRRWRRGGMRMRTAQRLAGTTRTERSPFVTDRRARRRRVYMKAGGAARRRRLRCGDVSSSSQPH
ncbi:hypothetical protein RR46_10585 [Papilio xuthus]|uniref:Uncharacterized protein n=1 Tax=Papilio xuthus TaxID=66420 RepID=A0A194PQB5_PAPXU|nr:hypothetical protein RR46_10585 [Papilio xuthus]